MNSDTFVSFVAFINLGWRSIYLFVEKNKDGFRCMKDFNKWIAHYLLIF